MNLQATIRQPEHDGSYGNKAGTTRAFIVTAANSCLLQVANFQFQISDIHSDQSVHANAIRKFSRGQSLIFVQAYTDPCRLSRSLGGIAVQRLIPLDRL
jgi:hypothetical protein